jgi:hypothetical protein
VEEVDNIPFGDHADNLIRISFPHHWAFVDVDLGPFIQGILQRFIQEGPDHGGSICYSHAESD